MIFCCFVIFFFKVLVLVKNGKIPRNKLQTNLLKSHMYLQWWISVMVPLEEEEPSLYYGERKLLIEMQIANQTHTHTHRDKTLSLSSFSCFHSSSDSELATKHYLKEKKKKKKLPQLKILPPPPNHTLFFTQAASQLVPLALSLYSPAQQTPVRTRSGKYMGQDATARVTHDGELVLWEEYFT